MAGAALDVWLRELRDRALLSQEELATRSGVSVGTVRGIEAGRIHRPRRATLVALADALGLDGTERDSWLAGRGQPEETGAPAAVPRQLPLDVVTFTGRERELAWLERDLAGTGATGPAVISAIEGAGGIGKSALAIHAAHRVAGRFRDGQLYVDLHGATFGLKPLAPLEVLGRFLRALGLDPGAIPADVDEAAAVFRSQVAGRSLLIVLDNARDARQVRPLLPAAPGCGVVVTSRETLSSLDGARHLHLDVLSEAEAIELLGRLAGRARIDAEPDVPALIVRSCGRLPLALRIAGARLAARPAWPLRVLADRLADQRRRLDELELADLGVRASFALSHQELLDSTDAHDRACAEAFGLLGLLDGPDFGVPVAARLCDPAGDPERVLERLVNAHLLESPGPGRYRLHDLLRLYARELAPRWHTEHARGAALTRAFGFYVATAWHTLALLRPGEHRLGRADPRWLKDGLEFADTAAALAWLETERHNLLAVARQAAATPGVPGEIAIQLAQAMFGFFIIRHYWRDWLQLNQTALSVARRIGDHAVQAHIHNDIGIAYWQQGQYDQALSSFQASRRLYRKLGDRHGEANTINNIGNVHERSGRSDQALACLQESLGIRRELGDRPGLASSLGNLGVVFERQGRYAESLACQQEGLAIRVEMGDKHGRAGTLANLGRLHQLRGRSGEAVSCLLSGIALCQELGDRRLLAEVLRNLGSVYHQQGRYEQAHQSLRESLAIRRDLGDRHGLGESLRDLGTTLRALGRPEETRAAWTEAVALFDELRTPDADQVRALLTELD